MVNCSSVCELQIDCMYIKNSDQKNVCQIIIFINESCLKQPQNIHGMVIEMTVQVDRRWIMSNPKYLGRVLL